MSERALATVLRLEIEPIEGLTSNGTSDGSVVKKGVLRGTSACTSRSRSSRKLSGLSSCVIVSSV